MWLPMQDEAVVDSESGCKVGRETPGLGSGKAGNVTGVVTGADCTAPDRTACLVGCCYGCKLLPTARLVLSIVCAFNISFNTCPENMIHRYAITPVVWLLMISHTLSRVPYYCTAYRLI
jgi:hypothetical protein